MEGGRTKLTEVNPHLVCVLCHGYFVDATTIAECLHSFCRSCIFRQLERKSICPICEVQVHNTKLHLSLRPDKTLQDIVYKLVPGLFHNEMQRRRDFYKNYPHRDEHLEPECRGVGLDRLIYSPDDLISLSLEFYDEEREREEWSNNTSPRHNPTPTSQESTNNGTKRYLQCPAGFKMAHLKKFIRQKYGLAPSCSIEIMYRRESLPDSYSLMDIAYIYTWKRNGPMRFYYRMPEVIHKQIMAPPATPSITNGTDAAKEESAQVEVKETKEQKVEKQENEESNKAAAKPNEHEIPSPAVEDKVPINNNTLPKDKNLITNATLANTVPMNRLINHSSAETKSNAESSNKTPNLPTATTVSGNKEVTLSISNGDSFTITTTAAQPTSINTKQPVYAKSPMQKLSQKQLSGPKCKNNKTVASSENKLKENGVPNGINNNRTPVYNRTPVARKLPVVPGGVVSRTGPTLDQRLQQLYRNRQTCVKQQQQPKPIMPGVSPLAPNQNQVMVNISNGGSLTISTQPISTMPCATTVQTVVSPQAVTFPAVTAIASHLPAQVTSNPAARSPMHSPSYSYHPIGMASIATPVTNTAVNAPLSSQPGPQTTTCTTNLMPTPASKQVSAQVLQKNPSGQRMNGNGLVMTAENKLRENGIHQGNTNSKMPVFNHRPYSKKSGTTPNNMINTNKTVTTLDQRLQQLYKNNSRQSSQAQSPTSKTSTTGPQQPPVPQEQQPARTSPLPNQTSSPPKQESRLASWLNTRFPPQNKTPPAVPAPVKSPKLEEKKEEKKESDVAKVGKEMSMLKKKLDELRRTQEGCEITQENPNPEDVKKRRDVTPDVSIELMRASDMKKVETVSVNKVVKEKPTGPKRPVPALKWIQDASLPKRKCITTDDDKVGVKKLKITTTVTTSPAVATTVASSAPITETVAVAATPTAQASTPPTTTSTSTTTTSSAGPKPEDLALDLSGATKTASEYKPIPNLIKPPPPQLQWLVNRPAFMPRSS